MAFVDPLNGLFSGIPFSSLASSASSSNRFEQAMAQASSGKTTGASRAQAARVQWLGAQWDKQQTLFGLLSSPDKHSASSTWKWAFDELTAPGGACGPAVWVSEVERVMGGMDPQVKAITQRMDLLTQSLVGRSTLPF